TDLMAAAKMELIVRHVRAGNVVGDHLQAVGAVGAGSGGDGLAVDQSCGSRSFGGGRFGGGGDDRCLRDRSEFEREVQDRRSVGNNGDVLLRGLKSRTADFNYVFADGNGV